MLQSLRIYHAFRLLMLGTLVSNSAFWMYQVAVGWLALQMTDSPAFVGLAGFAGGIPLLIFSVPAGVVIDRYDRRMVLLISQIGVAIVSLVFALMIGFDIIETWSLLVLVIVYGTIMSFVFPTRTAIVPVLVERHDLANGVALNSAVQNATRVVGPSLAGILIALTGIAETFAIATVLQVLALLTTFKLPAISSDVSIRKTSGWESLTLGFRVVSRDPYLIALIVLATAPTVLVMPYINLMPVFARDELQLGASGLGVLLASVGLGTVAGSLAVAYSAALRDWSGAQLLTAVLFAVAVLVFAVTPLIPLVIVLLFVAGWVSAVFLAINQTALQLKVDDSVRGRVISIYQLTWGVLPIGQLAVGSFADRIGTPVAMAISCILALACIAVIAMRFPMIRSAWA
jgi:MFS family permease